MSSKTRDFFQGMFTKYGADGSSTRFFIDSEFACVVGLTALEYAGMMELADAKDLVAVTAVKVFLWMFG